MFNPLLLITCEHGGNDIPLAYQYLFTSAEAILETHRGYDLGALEIAAHLQKNIADVYHATTISRLLVELNRSQHHSQLWSEFTDKLSKTEKQKVLDSYYFPYRHQVEQAIKKAISEGKMVLHIAIHSFTPILSGKSRKAEIGLLYDSKRKQEQQFCLSWQQQLQQLAPNWRIRRNYPYQGNSDGFPTYLRKQFAAQHYLGIELEINQALLSTETHTVARFMVMSLKHCLNR